MGTVFYILKALLSSLTPVFIYFKGKQDGVKEVEHKVLTQRVKDHEQIIELDKHLRNASDDELDRMLSE